MILIAYSDQKTILIEKSHKYIQEIYKKFQDDSGESNSEVKNFINQLNIIS